MMETSNLPLSKENFLFVKNITNYLLPSLKTCLQNKTNITLSSNSTSLEPLIHVGYTFQNGKNYCDTFSPLIIEECRQAKPNELESSYDLSLTRINSEDSHYHKKRKHDFYNQMCQGLIEKILYKSEILDSNDVMTDVENVNTASNQDEDKNGNITCTSNTKDSKASVWVLNVKLLDNSSSCEFSGGDLVYITTSASDQQQFLGVAFSIDVPRNSNNNNEYNFMKLYICLNQNPTSNSEPPSSSSTTGNQNGWIREEYIYEGAELRITSLTNITPSIRENSAIHSLYKLNPQIKNLLLTGRYQPPPPTTSITSTNRMTTLPTTSSLMTNKDNTTASAHLSIAKSAENDISKPPLNVPVELWNTLCRTYNHSQLLAIRDVCTSDVALGVL